MKIEPMSTFQIQGICESYGVGTHTVMGWILSLILAYAHEKAGRLKAEHQIENHIALETAIGCRDCNKDWLAEVLAELGWPKEGE